MLSEYEIFEQNHQELLKRLESFYRKLLLASPAMRGDIENEIENIREKLVELEQKLGVYKTDNTPFCNSEEINNGQSIQLAIEIIESMSMERLKSKVRDLIGNAKIKEALDIVATWAHQNNQKQLKNDVANLQHDLTNLKRQENLGILDFSEISRNKAQLNGRLLSLLDDIEESISGEIEEELISKVEVKPKASDKPLSVFISYSKRDNELKEELIIHLASLRRRNKATNWDDRHIIGGELWDDAIKTKLKEADIILFLVSASFIATDYIWDYEIPIAEEQRQNGKARVIPIILKPCQWTKLDFAKHQALPTKGAPISSFSDRDTAWLEVVEGIEKVINDVLK